MLAKIADFEAPVPRDDVVPRARRGRAAEPWPSAVAGAVAWLDLMHARPRAADQSCVFSPFWDMGCRVVATRGE